MGLREKYNQAKRNYQIAGKNARSTGANSKARQDYAKAKREYQNLGKQLRSSGKK